MPVAIVFFLYSCWAADAAVGAAPARAERTGTPRHRIGAADAMPVDGGASRIDGRMDAEIFTERTLGLEARGGRADETGIVGSGRRDVHVEIGLAPRK
ncbi:hypothetical protein [Microbacterium trichothecenolyticum]|uniref:Uncharacterized protein n=1 Tax=Microbacterium trichothecenolyticum TaxID=69370 RepID=A0ABU0TS12_MICTR|nr:hypothetical protein [Microbacterium trichothecenolyticum]MDQ1122456.1 hypothetical protein [Microbacterium trichothecenolyticum]